MRKATIAATCLVAAATGFAASDATRVNVEIPQQTLARSLIELGSLFNTVLSFAPDMVGGMAAPPVRGQLTLAESLAAALKGSGLYARIGAAGVELTRLPHEAPTQDGTMARAVILLDPVVITGRATGVAEGLAAQTAQSATRTETPLMDIPQSVSVLTRDSLALQGEPDAAAAMRYVSGSGVPSNVGGILFVDPPITMRGLPVQMLVSGMRSLRSPLTLESGLAERIEVAKGPNGAITGPAEAGGRGALVNFELKRPGEGRRAEARLELGSQNNGTEKSSFDLASAGRNGLTWRLLGYQQRTGRTEGGYQPEHAAGALASLRWRTREFDGILSLTSVNRRIAPPPATVSEGRFVDNAPSTVPALAAGQLTPASDADHLSARSHLLDLDLRWRLSSSWHMGLLLRQERNQADSEQHLAYTEGGMGIVSFDAEHSTSRLRSGQWSLTGSASTGPIAHKLMLALDRDRWSNAIDSRGTYWFFDEQTGPFIPGVSVLPMGDDIAYPPRRTRTRHDGFVLQDQLDWGPVAARLALRRGKYFETEFDPSGEPFEGATAPERNTYDMGIAYRTSPGTTFYAGTQRTFEALPGYDMIGSTKPAVVHQHQVGAKFSLFDDRALITVEAYKLSQRTPYVSDDGRSTLIPVRETKGLEIEYTGRVSGQLELSLGVEFVRSRDTVIERVAGSDEPFIYRLPSTGVPARSFRLLGQYRLPPHSMPRTSLGLALLGNSSTWLSLDSPLGPQGFMLRIPGGARIDLSLTREFDGLSLTGAINNATDRRSYSAYGSYAFIPLLAKRSFSMAARIYF